MNKTYYKSEDWLNGFESPSTGSIVCYDGWREYSDFSDRCTFIEVADCHQKIRLHKAQGDTIDDFITKAIKMRNALDCFINHLKENHYHALDTQDQEKAEKRDSRDDIRLLRV